MEKRNYRSYPEAFKVEALALLEKGEKSAGQIERELAEVEEERDILKKAVNIFSRRSP